MEVGRNMNGEKKKDAVFSALVSLEQNGRLTPSSVVDAARDPASPLHAQFEWDDGVAAERYREIQARKLIGTFHLVVIEEHRIIEAVAYVRDPDAQPREQGYVRTVTLRDDREKARDVTLTELARAAAHLSRARAIGSVLGLDPEMEALEARFAELRLRLEAVL